MSENDDQPLSRHRRLHYWLFGRRIREKACMCAAIALSGRQSDEAVTPMAWSLTVFFESYMDGGAEWTREPFGPKDPVKISAVPLDNG